MFSVKKGGLVCPDCGKDVIDGICLNQSTLYSMQYIESADRKTVYVCSKRKRVGRIGAGDEAVYGRICG